LRSPRAGILAIEAHPGRAVETIDARGKLVVPGLIDIHTHATRVKDGPALCLRDGVTGLVDADRRARIASAKRLWLPSRPAQCRVLINIGRAVSCRKATRWTSAAPMSGAAREAIGAPRDDCGVKAAVAGRRRRE